MRQVLQASRASWVQFDVATTIAGLFVLALCMLGLVYSVASQQSEWH